MRPFSYLNQFRPVLALPYDVTCIRIGGIWDDLGFIASLILKLGLMMIVLGQSKKIQFLQSLIGQSRSE
ncbi:hypothetical protein SAMN04488127_0897 [Bhargavaea ginsengi]|uniref:Uncharacterized protein n=1 Tax=Bhargavaea ginsengi TaxID=426757 RepID=A0A1H6UUE0_9BACL|nr:hypothetical protein SAMN04488127_0897 [Bhargavaea ginsengi]